MLQPIPIPGLFVTGTDTGVGKTLITGAIARWFHLRGHRVAVSKPVASGCVTRREGIVSEDAEFLAHQCDTRHPLDIICPQRLKAPLAPYVAALQEKKEVDWQSIRNSHAMMARDSQIMLVEGAGGICVPIDSKYLMLDMIGWLKKPVVVVAWPALGTINHTTMTVRMLRAAGANVAGVIINRYPPDGKADVAEETNPKQIEKWAQVPVLAIVPQEPFDGPDIPGGIMDAIDQVDWTRFVG